MFLPDFLPFAFQLAFYRSAGTYMAEALEMVCRRQRLDNPKDWALLLEDPRILIPLDRTVASLQGKRELLLIKRSEQANMGPQSRAAKTTDPNGKLFDVNLSQTLMEVTTASILKRMSEVPEEQGSDDFTAAYKVCTFWR